MTPEALRQRFLDRCRLAGVEPTPVLTNGVVAYFELLRAWNRRINLTALNLDSPDDEAMDRLLIEPVLATSLIPQTRVHVIDVGSGGGSPAIPFRLGLVNASMTLVESRHKKAVFLREVIRTLGLSDTRVEARRLEEVVQMLGSPDLADVVTIRAVRVDANLLAHVHQALKCNGRLLLFGANTSEAESASRHGFEVESVRALALSQGSKVAVLRKSP